MIWNKKLNAWVTEPYTDLRQMWGTPDDFYAATEASVGKFDLDSCAVWTTTKCDVFIAPEDDGLSVRWTTRKLQRIWCNPGFSDIGPWCNKAYNETRRYPGSMAAVLAIPSFSADWWEDWVVGKASEVRLICGERIQFVPHKIIPRSSNARENCLIIYRGDHPVGQPARIWEWYWKGK